MPRTMHLTGRRALLAAGGTLLIGAIPGKYPGRYLGRARADVPRTMKSMPVAAIRPHPPTRLPPLVFEDGAGRARPLADYVGRGVVLNFWATWCAPCVLEMAALDALSQRLSGQGSFVLAVSEDRSGAAAVREFYAAHRISHLPVLLDPHLGAMRALGLEDIPTTLLLDRQGRAVAGVDGPVQWDSPDAAALVSRLVG